MSEQTVSFSLRMPRVADYRALQAVASMQGKSIAALSREFVLDGLRRDLDPAEIERRMDEEKQRLMQAAAELREGSTP